MMTWLGGWLGLGWEAPPSGVGLYNSSDQKGNRSAAERAGNCTHSSQSSPEGVRPGLANRQGWGALGVPEAQLSYDSSQSCSIRDGWGELRTAEGLPNSSASSWKASEGESHLTVRWSLPGQSLERSEGLFSSSGVL